MRRSKGSILVIVLWALSFLTVMAVSMSVTTRSRISFIGRLKNRHYIRYVGEAGVESAITFLADSKTADGYDALNLSWANGSSRFQGRKIGNGTFEIVYEEYDKLTGKMEKKYGIVDEERKINLNTAEYNTISDLIRIVTRIDEKEADDIAAAIIDWRDPDDFPLINGVESRYYKSRRFPYLSKNAPFEVLEELTLVRGVTADIYEKIKPYVTVYGTGTVNINTAGKIVLTALVSSESLANKILRFREGSDGKIGTIDDNILMTDAGIVAKISKNMPLVIGEVAVLTNLLGKKKIGVSSSVFTIRSVGSIGSAPARIEIECVFDRDKIGTGEIGIKYWHERYFTESPVLSGDNILKSNRKSVYVR